MSTLTDPFPESVTVSGVEYPIYADFRTVLRCFEIQGRKAELSEDDLLSMLRLFYNVKRMTATEDHIDQMFWFFSCGREKEKKKFPRKIAGSMNKQPFDFEGDADLIYAGFMRNTESESTRIRYALVEIHDSSRKPWKRVRGCKR